MDPKHNERAGVHGTKSSQLAPSRSETSKQISENTLVDTVGSPDSSTNKRLTSNTVPITSVHSVEQTLHRTIIEFSQQHTTGQFPEEVAETLPNKVTSKDGSGSINICVSLSFGGPSRRIKLDTAYQGYDMSEYMKWKFVLNTPTLLYKCKEQFKDYKIDFELDPVCSLILSTAETSEYQAKDIASQVIKYAIKHLGEDLVIRTYDVLEKHAVQMLQEINKVSDKRQAYAEIISGTFCVAYRASCEENINKMFEAYVQDSHPAAAAAATEHRYSVIKEKVFLEEPLCNFESIILGNEEIKKCGVSVRFEQGTKQLDCILRGTPDNLVKAKLVLDEMKKGITESRIIFSTETTDVLHYMNVEDICNDLLKEKYPNCKARQQPKYISVYGFRKTDVDNAKLHVSKLIMENSQVLTGNIRNNTENLTEHLNIKFKNRVVVHVTGTFRLHMVGLKDAINEANTEFIDIIEGRKSISINAHSLICKKETEQQMSFRDRLHVRFIAKSALLKQASEEFKVRICPQYELNALRVTGLPENVSRALEHLQQIEASLITESTTASDTEVIADITQESWNECNECFLEEFGVLVVNAAVFSTGHMQISKEANVDNSIWTKDDGKLLVLKHVSFENVIAADLTYLPIKSDPNRGSRFNSKICQGRKIVDIGVPDFTTLKDVHQEEVEHITTWALKKANDGNVSSVAFLVSPVADWIVIDLMECIAKSAINWLVNSPRQNLYSVLLCTEDKDCFAKTDAFIDKLLQNTALGTQAGYEMKQPKITVVQGYIDRAQADVIVNTADSSLKLLHGGVSLALLKAAGERLQTECCQNYPQGITSEDIAVTNGYMLKCKKVFHITLQSQYKATATLPAPLRIRNAMELCLKKANDYKFKSIAFPAIGTGMLKYKEETVASEMIMSIERFTNDCLSTTIEEVQFVVHPKDTDLFQKFQRMQQSLGKPKSESENRSVDLSIAIRITGKIENVNKFKTFLTSKTTAMKRDRRKNTSQAIGKSLGQHGESYGSGRSAENSTYHCGNIAVRVYEADIIKVSVECIVNAANCDLKHYGGIAHVIAEAAGPSLQIDCDDIVKQRGTVQVTNVVLTKPGKLPYRFVFHAVGPCYFDYKPISKSSLEKCAQDLKQTVVNCLKLAEQENITTIALPSISSGLFGVPKDVCAIQYAKAVIDFSRSSISLKEIHFVDKSREMIDIIHKCFNPMIAYGKPAPFNTGVYIEQSAVKEKKTEKGLVKNTGRDKPKSVTESTLNKERSEVHATYSQDDTRLLCTFAKWGQPDIEVLIYHGDIINMSGPVAVVCSDNRPGEGKGVVAKLLLQKGGELYRQQKKLQFFSSRRYGEVITTTGGNNNYTWIMHAIISKSDPAALASLYRNVFKEVQVREFQSVALPLLGTGFGSIDPRSSAEFLFEELLLFCQTKRKTALKLHVVINDFSVSNTVKDAFKWKIDAMSQTSEFPSDETLFDVKEKSPADDGGIGLSQKEAGADEDCVICMDRITNAKKLQCGHRFCTECIDGYFRVKQVCPTCGKVCGVITGDQPDGYMRILKLRTSVAGYEQFQSIAITYRFENGVQKPAHPQPGAPYKGITRTAYLPNNEEGRTVCAMLIVAFQRRLVFTIGASRTTGKECVITWNDIHHKTDLRPNTQFGYPDKTYLQRVREELEVKGVTAKDTDAKLIKELEKDNFGETVISNIT